MWRLFVWASAFIGADFTWRLQIVSCKRYVDKLVAVQKLNGMFLKLKSFVCVPLRSGYITVRLTYCRAQRICGACAMLPAEGLDRHIG